MILFLFLFYITGIAISYLILRSEHIQLTFGEEEVGVDERQRLMVAAMWPMVGLAAMFLTMAVGFVIIFWYTMEFLHINLEPSDLKSKPEDGDEECEVTV